MKIFGNDLEKYSKPPIAMILDIDPINSGYFIQIPGSKNKIMKKCLTKHKELIDYLSYADILGLIAKLNDLSDERQFRLPYLDEIKKTYYRSGDEEFARSFRKDIEPPMEFLSEIIVGSKFLIRDPTYVKISYDEEIGLKIECKGKKLPIKLADENGFFDAVNKYGYPSGVIDYLEGTSPIKVEPVYWYTNDLKSDFVKKKSFPVLCDWDHENSNMNVFTSYCDSLLDCATSARLVEVCR